MADKVTRGRDRRRMWVALAAVGVAALIVRLVFYFQLGRTPFGDTAFLDAGYYSAWADQIAAGDWLGGVEPFFVEPGYLYVLALGKSVGTSIAGFRLLQAFVGTGTAVLTALLCRRLGGGPVSAGAAGMLVALYAPLVHYEGQLLKTTFEVFAATLAVLLAITPRVPPLIIGLTCGAALLLKSNFTVALPFVLAFVAWQARKDGRAPGLAAALVVVGIAPFLVATAARNAVVADEPLILPWSSGINFYIGNGPEADGLDPTLPFIQAGPSREGAEGKREAERRAGRPLGFSESSDFWWAETRRAIAKDPGRWLGLLIDKTRLLLHEREFTDNLSLAFVSRRATILAWLPFGMLLAVPLACVGLVATAAQREPRALLVAGILLAQAAGIVLFHVLDRYRLAIVPLAIALGVSALADSRRRSTTRAMVLGAAAGIGIVLTGLLPPPVGGRGQNLAGQHRLLGVHALDQGDYARAVAEFEEAVALNPGIQNFHLRLALARRLAGDEPGADQAETRGLALDAKRGPLRLGLLLQPYFPERAARACLRAAEFGDKIGASLYCAGTSLRTAERRREAEVALHRAALYAPEFFEAWVALGEVRLELADVAGTRRAWQRAIEIDPGALALRRRLESLPPDPPELPLPSPATVDRAPTDNDESAPNPEPTASPPPPPRPES